MVGRVASAHRGFRLRPEARAVLEVLEIISHAWIRLPLRAMKMTYQGLLPDLFREGQGVVAEGALDSSGVFKADVVLAKHDENYMPKDVADALKKQGYWKEEYGAKPNDSAKSAGNPAASRAAQGTPQTEQGALR